MSAATVGALLDRARQRLRAAAFEPSPREALLLLGHVLARREAQLLARPEAPVAPDARRRFEALLARRLQGEPVAYLTGEREFYGRAFQVDARVLIPRPETEHLIERALDLALPPAPRIVDLGTGSGCIAITLAAELPAARLLAIDRSLAALRVADANRRRHGVAARVALAGGDLGAAVAPQAIDLLVSNPPYVDPQARARLSPEVVRYEPAAALFAPGAGRALIAGLLDLACRLRPGTPTVLEIGHDQAAWLRRAVAARAGLRLEHLIDDYGGIPRTALLRTV